MTVTEAAARARVRSLERERRTIAKALREHTAQVLASSILQLTAAVRAEGQAQVAKEDLDGLRGTLREELLHILTIAGSLD